MGEMMGPMMKQSTQNVAPSQTEVICNRDELQTLQVDQEFLVVESTITVADYILSRLAEIGVTVCLDP